MRALILDLYLMPQSEFTPTRALILNLYLY